MTRIQLLLLLLTSLLATTLAMRGQSVYQARHSVRGLVEKGAEKGMEKGAEKGIEKGAEKGVAKGAEKGVEKGAEKGVEKGAEKGVKSSKKCKKAKSSHESSKASPKQTAAEKEAKPTAQEQEEEVELVEDEEEPYCLHAELSPEECAAIKKGKVPEDDPNVKGGINMEIAYDDDTSPDQIMRNVEDILRTETPPKFVGCEKRRRHRYLAEETGDSGESFLSVTGVEFKKLAISKKGCAKETTAASDPNTNCDKIQTDAHVFYTGKEKVTEEEQQEMFDLLVETIQTQAATGSFADVGEVKSIESTTDGSGDGGSGVGLPIGVAIGAVGIVALLGGVFWYKRRSAVAERDAVNKADGDTSESSAEEHMPQAHAVVVDDATKGKKKQDETIEVEAVAHP